MIDIKTLLPELKKLVTELSEDLLARRSENSDIDAGLREAYTQIEKGGRTGAAFEVWREDYLDQVAVAWVLGCVFVRFMEDNGLIDECWLAGEGDRRTKAEDAHELYFREHPKESDRDYFEHVFREVGKIPACHDLFAEGKTPLWAVGPSGDAAMKLLAFWREINTDSGKLIRTFDVEEGNTRFLGDLYQDLSERARNKYALLQTPVFVEEFILDRTLDPAIDEFGLDEVRMIDPTCGSGHFLLGAFARLFKLWSKRENNERVAAQKALDGVWGVDINPFAVAIARFRLIVAAIQACGISRLETSPQFNVSLATGDSLLFGSRWDRQGKKISEQQFLGTEEESWAPEIYACEDKDAITEALSQQYHAVVGNPPYITVKDKRLSSAYRDRYSTCSGKYSLVAPFTERFFDLAIRGERHPEGYVGLIVSNSFMKRQFGRQLIENYLPTIDLTHVIDTEGAYIPGHTTSTVILLGRSRNPISSVVRGVLGIRGESSIPNEPSVAPVWLSIVRSVDQLGYEDEYVSVSDIPRKSLNTHPWSLGGGGAPEVLEELVAEGEFSLSDFADSIGITCFTLEDDVYILSRDLAQRRTISPKHLRGIVGGNDVRNWRASDSAFVVFPYGSDFAPASEDLRAAHFKYLWRYRTNLSSSKMFGGKSKVQSGLRWYEFGRLTFKKFRTPLSIAFAEIATHNHFALDRGGRIFTQSAPIVKLRTDATDDTHFALLALLNSSVICFWAKQVMPCKGLGGQGGGIKPEHWSRQYVFNGTTMGKCPIPKSFIQLSSIGRKIDSLATEVGRLRPEKILDRLENFDLLETQLRDGQAKYEQAHRQMVAAQEELDWRCYSIFGFTEYVEPAEPLLQEGLHPEDRPVERLLRREIEKGVSSIFYDVHKYRGTGPQTPLASPYERLIEGRMEVLSQNAKVRLVEHVDFKRRWQVEPWQKQTAIALKGCLLSQLESEACWTNSIGSAELRSLNQIAAWASSNRDFLQVAALFRGYEDFDVAVLVAELVSSDCVPLIPRQCYKPSGLRKRALWEQTWKNQRREDEGENVTEIKMPPKYKSSDFQKTDYWRMRGKLDVPKERWISFPHCERDGDDSLVVGWAGWNHLQQATAIVAYYDARKNDGWNAERLMPLIAAIDQLLPWIHQSHHEIDTEFNETAGASFQTLLESEAEELGLTLEDIRNWTPPKKTKKTAKKKKSKKTKSKKLDDD